jgi:hypothetical protein
MYVPYFYTQLFATLHRVPVQITHYAVCDFPLNMFKPAQVFAGLYHERRLSFWTHNAQLGGPKGREYEWSVSLSRLCVRGFPLPDSSPFTHSHDAVHVPDGIASLGSPRRNERGRCYWLCHHIRFLFWRKCVLPALNK